MLACASDPGLQMLGAVTLTFVVLGTGWILLSVLDGLVRDAWRALQRRAGRR